MNLRKVVAGIGLLAGIAGCGVHAVKHYYRPGTPAAQEADISNLDAIMGDLCGDTYRRYGSRFECKQSFCTQYRTGSDGLIGDCLWMNTTDLSLSFSDIKDLRVEGQRVYIGTTTGDREVVAKDITQARDLADVLYALSPLRSSF